MKHIIEKVNHYSNLAKQRELTDEEKLDREKYRKEYIAKFRDQVRGHLDNIKVVDKIEAADEYEPIDHSKHN